MTRGLVLFDFDGTIADSLEIALAAYNDVAPKLGIPRIAADDARLRHMNPREALRASEIPLWKVPQLISAVRTGMRERMHAVPLFPGMDTAIDEIRRSDFRCGIVSSNARENIEQFLDRHRIGPLEVLGSGASLFGKPALLKKVLRSERYEARRAFYVGDEVRDIVAASDVGMRSVAVSWGYASRDALVAERPNILVDRPQDLPRMLFEA